MEGVFLVPHVFPGESYPELCALILQTRDPVPLALSPFAPETPGRCAGRGVENPRCILEMAVAPIVMTVL